MSTRGLCRVSSSSYDILHLSDLNDTRYLFINKFEKAKKCFKKMYILFSFLHLNNGNANKSINECVFSGWPAFQ